MAHSAVTNEFSNNFFELFFFLYLALVGQTPVFYVQFWTPHLKKNIEVLEYVQRSATNLMKGLENISCKE